MLWLVQSPFYEDILVSKVVTQVYKKIFMRTIRYASIPNVLQMRTHNCTCFSLHEQEYSAHENCQINVHKSPTMGGSVMMSAWICLLVTVTFETFLLLQIHKGNAAFKTQKNVGHLSLTRFTFIEKQKTKKNMHF